MHNPTALRERLLECLRRNPPDSITALCKEIGLSHMTVSDFLKGKRRNPDIKTYLRLEGYVIRQENIYKTDL